MPFYSFLDGGSNIEKRKSPHLSKLNLLNFRPFKINMGNEFGRLKAKCGLIISKRYRVVQEVSSGTFSNVYLCKDLQVQRNVILKVYRLMQEFANCAFREIQVMKMLNKLDPNNSHFIKYYGFCKHNNHVCIILQQFGCSLFDAFEIRKFKPFNIYSIRQIIYNISQSLQVLHKSGIVHTDIKLENVLLPIGFDCIKGFDADPLSDPSSCCGSSSDDCISTTTSTNFEYNIDARLIDFGSLASSQKWHESLATTRRYRAPEILLGIKWGIECDIWSLGCLLIELIDGNVEFDSNDDLKHLFMIQHTLGQFPKWMIKSSPKKQIRESYCHGLIKPEDDCLKDLKTVPPIVEKLKFDDELNDLALKMLRINPFERITIEEVLEHKFFQYCR